MTNVFILKGARLYVPARAMDDLQLPMLQPLDAKMTNVQFPRESRIFLQVKAMQAGAQAIADANPGD